MRLARTFLLLQALGLSAFGLLMFFKPETALVFLGAPSFSSDGLYEIRSIYGGTSLGAAALLFAGAFKADMMRPALYFSLAYTGGYVFVRIAALPLDGIPGRMFWAFIALEVVTTLLAVYFLRRIFFKRGSRQLPADISN